MVDNILLFHLFRKKDHKHSLQFQKFLNEDPRYTTIECLLSLIIFGIFQRTYTSNDFHSLLINIIIDLCPQHFMIVIVANDGIFGIFVNSFEYFLYQIHRFELFLYECQKMMNCVWYEISILFLLHQPFHNLSALIWLVVIIVSFFDIFFAFLIVCLFDRKFKFWHLLSRFLKNVAWRCSFFNFRRFLLHNHLLIGKNIKGRIV